MGILSKYWMMTAHTNEFSYEVMTVMTEKKLLVYVCSGELEIGNRSIANIFYIYKHKDRIVVEEKP